MHGWASSERTQKAVLTPQNQRRNEGHWFPSSFLLPLHARRARTTANALMFFSRQPPQAPPGFKLT